MVNKKNKWGPPGLLKRPDNIISSEARARNDNGFQPSYINEPNAIGLLLSNEYQRQWFKERAIHEKELFSTDKQIVQFKRRFVQKMMTYKPSRKIDIIEDKLTEKRRENEMKTNKKGNISQSKPDYTKIKYKISCLSSKLKGDSKETKSGAAKSKDVVKESKTKNNSTENNNKSMNPVEKLSDENITEEGDCC